MNDLWCNRIKLIDKVKLIDKELDNSFKSIGDQFIFIDLFKRTTLEIIKRFSGSQTSPQSPF